MVCRLKVLKQSLRGAAVGAGGARSRGRERITPSAVSAHVQTYVLRGERGTSLTGLLVISLPLSHVLYVLLFYHWEDKGELQ